MRVIATRTVRECWQRYADAEGPLKAWMADAERASWKTTHAIKADYASASILSTDRVVFNIKGNTYRLIVSISYVFGAVYVKWFGTHAEYDKINALTVGQPQRPKPNEGRPKPRVNHEEEL